MQRLIGRSPGSLWWNDVIQLAKTALAAVASWVIAANLLDLPQPYLAPWSALLVVHATVYRTFSRGVQQVGATVLAVLLAAAVGELMGLTTEAVAALVIVGLLIGTLPWFRAEAVTTATTGLVVLTTGFQDDTMLISRLLDTGIGVGVGLLVNVAVWPPLRHRAALSAIDGIDDRIGALLADMADRLDQGCTHEDVAEWIERTRDLDGDLDQAWSLVRQARESARGNPRRSAGRLKSTAEWEALLHAMEQAIAEVRSMARTLGADHAHRPVWDDGFSARWIDMLGATGRAARGADAAGILTVRTRLEDFAEDLRSTERSSQWPIYGALIVNLRNIIDALGKDTGRASRASRS